MRDACVERVSQRRPRLHQGLHKAQRLHQGLHKVQRLHKGVRQSLTQGLHQEANMGSVYTWEMDPTITVVVFSCEQICKLFYLKLEV